MPSTRGRNNLSATEKLHLIFRVRSGESVESVAENTGINKKSLYHWLRLVSKIDGKEALSAIENNYASGENHWKKISSSHERKILKIALKNNNWGAQRIAEQLGRDASGKLLVSSHGVHRVLAEHGLSRKENRAEYFEKNGTSLVPTPNRNVKIEMIRAVETGESISSVCMRFGVSRPTFYKWYRRWKEALDKERDASLSDKRPSAEKHWRFHPQARENVLGVVLRNPEENLEGIVKRLPKKADGTPILSRSGVHGVLAERGLSTLEARKDWARQQKELVGVPAIRPITAWLERLKQVFEQFLPTRAPAPPPGVPPVRGKHIFSSLWRFAPYLFFLLLITFGFFEWGRFLSTAQTPVQAAGYLFASIALATGSVFFLYSLKYYFTLAVVLSFSRESDSTSELRGPTSKVERSDLSTPLRWLGRLFGLTSGESAGATPEAQVSSGGLEPDLAQVELERKPFISVHIPMFNEKRVAERILKACTSFDYENYEIIVADDSTDETTNIVRQFAEQWNTGLKRSDLNSGMARSDLHRPLIKVIHRDTREGFKGGALKEALKHTDSKAEFIVVFDADFVPYPDTLELFLKYFQVNAGSLQKLSFKERKAQLSESSSTSDVKGYQDSNIAAIQGYQWHVLNKSENWITRGVRSEYAGSYVIERSGEELYGGLKQIAGSVYMIRRDLLDKFGWGTSLTEDFELTLRLYEQGYKVVYTPYIQAPAECASTLNRLIRQRMRWAEGHSMNIRKMFGRMLATSKIRLSEKLEFLYLSPYYLQAAFFIIGTICWILSETLFQSKLPFWTAVWGWSLVLTNLLSLPLMNSVGLFLEEAEERDYVGTASFVLLSYLLAPFQAYASVKGFLEREEGPWFRTPKTGRITDIFRRGRFYRFIRGIFPGRSAPVPISTEASRFSLNPAFSTANNQFNSFQIQPRRRRWIGNLSLVVVTSFTIILFIGASFIPQALDSGVKPSFRSLVGAVEALEAEVHKEEITGPVNLVYQKGPEILEYIFHPEPRVRVKLGHKEIETTVIGSENLGRAAATQAFKQGNIYVYEDIFEGVDLEYIAENGKLEEHFVLSEYKDFGSIEERIRLNEIVMGKVDGEIQFAPEEGGYPLFKFPRPYMYEEDNQEMRSDGLEYELQEGQFGYTLKKVLTVEGKAWLADPERVFPVVIDPTLVKSTVDTSVSSTEATFGSAQRKIAYSATAVDGAAWYVVFEQAADVVYARCLQSTGCNDNTDWSSNFAVQSDSGGGRDPSAPTFYRASDARLWVAWIDDAGANPDDTVHFRYIDTTSTFGGSGHTLGNDCESDDQGTLDDTSNFAYLAVTGNGDFVVGYSDTANDSEADIFEVASSVDCTGASPHFTSASNSIESGSGLPTGGATFVVVPTVKTNEVFLIYNDDNGGNDMRVDVRDTSTNSWDSTDTDIDGLQNYNVLEFSATSDGTDIWLLVLPGSATAPDFFRCGACSATGPTFTDESDNPFGTPANAEDVSLTYISGSNELNAFILRDTTNQQVYVNYTDADTISWKTEESLSYTAGDSSDLSSVYSAPTDDDVGTVLRYSSNDYEFSTVPEYLWLFIGLSPLVVLWGRKLAENRGGRRMIFSEPVACQ